MPAKTPIHPLQSFVVSKIFRAQMARFLPIFALFMLLGAAPSFAQYPFTVADLSQANCPSGGCAVQYQPLYAFSINNSGVVVGNKAGEGGNGFVYANGTVTFPLANGVGYSFAAINNAGYIVGGAAFSANEGYTGGYPLVFLLQLQQDGSLSSAYQCTSGAFSIAGDTGAAINNLPSPWVTGLISSPPSGFLFSGGTFSQAGCSIMPPTPAVIPRAPGFVVATGAGLNNAGVVAGYFYNGDPCPLTASLYYNLSNVPCYMGFAFSNGQVSALGSLLPGGGSQANSINNNGVIVGWTDTPSGNYLQDTEQAMMYSNGTMQALGYIPGHSCTGYGTEANAINNSGQIVGQDHCGHAFLYSSGYMMDVTPPGWAVNLLTAINDNGVIVGSGINPNGLNTSFVLTPTPGTTQFQPAAPTPVQPGEDSFPIAISGNWFQSSTTGCQQTSGFTYRAAAGTLFTEISGFPTGFSGAFTVTAGGTVLGSFGPGQTLPFPGSGVSQFTISGITPPVGAANGTGFPLQIVFNTPSASFTMSAVDCSGSTPVLSSMAVTPANPFIAVGANVQFAATGTYSDGSTADLTSNVTWVSSDMTKATMAAGGLATGIAAGSTNITAMLSGITSSPAAVLTVTLPPITFVGAQTTVSASGLNRTYGVAVDGAGNVFIADPNNGRVVKVPANGGAQTIVGTGLTSPAGLAVDKAGDLFIVDLIQNQVVEVPAGGGPQITISSGLNSPFGVAVDGMGDVFIADTNNNQVVEVPANGGAQITIASGLNRPYGVAVGGAGNIFVADTSDNGVFEIPSGGGAPITVGGGLSYPAGLAVDASGDLFIADSGNNRVVEVPAGGGTQIALGTGLAHPLGVALDGAGDVFVADDFNYRVAEVQRGAVNLGGINICPGGQTTPAPCNETVTLNYSVNVDTTFGSNPTLVTQGAPNLDFTLSSTTCTGTVTAGSFCTVNAKFAPLAPGLRKGAAQLTDNSGNLLVTTLTHGIGQGPAIAFGPGTQTTLPANELNDPGNVAVDSLGNLFIADARNNRVVKVPAGGGAQTTVGTGLNFPTGVAVDGAGDVFIADYYHNQVAEVPAGGGAQIALGTGLSLPSEVAVDGAGDVFVADGGNNRVVEIPAGGGAQTTVGTGLNYPYGVAVDGAGDVFIADAHNNRVVEVPAGGGPQTTVGTGLNFPTGVAVDGAGDVFVADYGNDRVVEVPAGGNAQITLVSGLSIPTGVAVDGTGDVFIADAGNNRVLELQESQPPIFGFATTSVGNTSTDSPQSVTVQNIGNEPLSASSLGLTLGSTSFEQVAGSGNPADCNGGFSLASGASCNLSIRFVPQTSGNIGSAATFTDNALNVNGASQSIALQGTGTVVPAITSANSATFALGVSGSFTVTTTGFPTPALNETGTLPGGVTFTDNHDGTGTLAGMATVNGAFNITFSASNAAGTSGPQNFTLTINQAPAITSAASTSFTIGIAGSFAVTATGVPSPALSETGALPTGVTFSAVTGSLSGVPAGTSGTYDITFKASNGVSPNASQAFTLTVINPPVPTLGSINSNSGVRGTTVPVTLTGTGFTTTGTTVTVSGTGVTPGTVTVVNSTTITTSFTISATATLTARNVTVRTLGGTSNVQTFTVQGASLASINPNTGARGSSVPVTLTGGGLTGATAITGVGGGITVSGLTVVNDTTVTATFTISAAAVLMPRNVSVTTPIGATNTVAFTVIAPPAPTLTSVAPNMGVRGTAVPVTLTGTNFTTTGATASVSGTGISVGATTVVNSTTITATFTISATATISARTVTITTPGGTSAAQTFTVQGPTLASITPGTGVRGTNVPVTMFGTNLMGATAVTISGTGVICTGITSTNTTVNASCAISSGATVSARNVSVITPIGKTNVLTGAFTVQGPMLASVTPGAGVRGTNVPVSLNGTNLTGASAVSISGAGVTCAGITSTASTVNANCAITTGATVSARNVSVVTPIGTTNVLSGAFTVQGPMLISITPTAGNHGTTVPVSLTGANLTGATAVTISGGGITCTGITSIATTVNASCAITAGASLGARNVSINTPIGATNTLIGAFTVN